METGGTLLGRLPVPLRCRADWSLDLVAQLAVCVPTPGVFPGRSVRSSAQTCLHLLLAYPQPPGPSGRPICFVGAEGRPADRASLPWGQGWCCVSEYLTHFNSSRLASLSPLLGGHSVVLISFVVFFFPVSGSQRLVLRTQTGSILPPLEFSKLHHAGRRGFPKAN